MTDLRGLLDHAAGEEPAVTGEELFADLARGRRAARRRRVAAAGSAAAATALVVAATWAVLPGTSLSTEPGIVGSPTPTTSTRASEAPMTTEPRRAPVPRHTPVTLPPYAARPVRLVQQTVRAGMFRCTLHPAGWVVKRVDDALVSGDEDVLILVDPRFDSSGYEPGNDDISVQPSRLMSDGSVPKYSKGWDAFPHHRAGGHEAVMSRRQGPSGWYGDMFVRTDADRLFQVNVTAHAGWDLATALRFAGSCDYAR
jgi:hypothetical protein